MSLLTMFHAAFAEQPNIILILTDDLGYGDLGMTGHPYIKSPNIDRLAAEGLFFEQGYMSSAWCAPSRAAIMGGYFPARYFQSDHELDYNKPTLASVLKDAGYTTAHYGKWHMSGRGKTDPTPDMYGFEESFISNGNPKNGGWTPEERKQPHWREMTTSRYIDLSIDFITRKKDVPFFVNVWLFPTHSYIDPTPEMLEVYKDLEVSIDDFENPLQKEFLEFIAQHGSVQDAMRAYCSDVTFLDSEIGRLLEKLKELDLKDNTIVIFSSDNGPAPIFKKAGLPKRYKETPTLLNNVGSAGPYRNRKVSLYDGGTHVPFIVRWPKKIKPGKVDPTTIFTGVDLMPTLAVFAGAQVPGDLDGEDLSGAWLAEPVQRQKYHYWNDRPGWSTLRHKQWKAHLNKGEFQLYDIYKDKSESKNVADQHPELSKEYLSALKKWDSSVVPNYKSKDKNK